MQSYQEIRNAAVDAIGEGDHELAYRTFRAAIEFGSGSLDGSEAQFADAFRLFAQISEHFASEDFVGMIRRAAEQPNDVQGLYDLGYALYEEGLFGIGATVLTRAEELAPGEPAIISELVSSLENCNLCPVAVEVLQRYPDLTQSDFWFAYLLAFNSVMSGDLSGARETRATLPDLSDGSDDQRVMTGRIDRFLQRADRVSRATPLDESDLRGWHYVITGGILTCLSPHGYPDPMNGRYAFLQDSMSAIRQGIDRLCHLVAQKRTRVERVIGLEDRGSQILATAVANAMDMSLAPWTEGEDASHALLVAYDLSAIDLSAYEQLRQRSPGQLLYSHALSWVQSCPIAPDVVTLLHQFNSAPWESQMRVDPDTNELAHSDPDQRPVETIAREILEASSDTDEVDEDSVPQLTNEFLNAVGPFPEAEDQREIAWETSPVPSARFN